MTESESARVGVSVQSASTGTFLVRAIARLIDIGVGIGAGCFASVVGGVLLATLRGLGFSGSSSLHSAGNLIFGSFIFGIAFAIVGAVCAQASSEAIAGTSLGKLMLGFRVVSLSQGDVLPCAPMAAAAFHRLSGRRAVPWLLCVPLDEGIPAEPADG